MKEEKREDKKEAKSKLKIVTFSDILPSIPNTELDRRRAVYEKIYAEYKVVDHFEDGKSGNIYFVCEV